MPSLGGATAEGGCATKQQLACGVSAARVQLQCRYEQDDRFQPRAPTDSVIHYRLRGCSRGDAHARDRRTYVWDYE